MKENIYSALLERKLVDLGFSIQNDGNDIFRLNLNEDYSKTLTVKLIRSQIIDYSIHGSHNNTPIKSIGYFCFNFPPPGNKPDYFIFSFINTLEKRVEFIIIPNYELRSRLSINHSTNDIEIEIMFWLLPDNSLYNATNIGGEGEYVLILGGMSKTKWDFTSFFNSWEILSMK